MIFNDSKKKLFEELIQINYKKEYLRDLCDKIKNENLKKKKEIEEMDTNYSEIEKSIINLQEERDELLNDIIYLEKEEKYIQKELNEKKKQKQKYKNEIMELECIDRSLEIYIQNNEYERKLIKEEYEQLMLRNYMNKKK